MLQSHKLAPLLTPKRVALVGASPKEGTVGNGMIVAASLGDNDKPVLIGFNEEVQNGARLR